MIIDIWKPIFKGGGNNRRILCYEMTDIDKVMYSKKTGYIVRYTCDKCQSDNIKTTTTSSLFRNVVYNTFKFQTCRSCRSKISEYEIKKTQISFSVILESIKSSGYKLYTQENEYNLSDNRSQFKLNCVCENNHEYQCTWNNWRKGKRCRMCYENNKFINSVKSKDGWKLYYFLVWKYTNINYKKYKSVINPSDLKRGKSKNEYNLDHKFSVSEGFRNNIPPIIIASIGNLEMIDRDKNFSKGTACSIKLENLFENYFFVNGPLPYPLTTPLPSSF